MSGGGDAKIPEAAAYGGDALMYGQQYGTFQGVPRYVEPAAIFPRQDPPPVAAAYSPPYNPGGIPAYCIHRGYDVIPVVEGSPLILRPLPFCGLGAGWFLFITGFFLGSIPWYVGAFILLCVHVDYREKPGFLACSIAAVIALIALLGVSKGAALW